MKKQIFTQVILPLFIGTLIYILFRPLHQIFWGLLNIPPIEAVNKFAISNINLPSWFIYNLPNGLWLFSFIKTISFLKYSSKSNLLLSIPILISVLYEIGQFTKLLPGTFDITDITTCLTFGVFALVSNKNNIKISFGNNVKRNLVTFNTLILFTLFASSTNGPADAFVDSQIQSEKDPVKKEKKERIEQLYHEKGRVKATAHEIDSINALVDSLVTTGNIDTTSSKKSN
jgi:hypothetical protein